MTETDRKLIILASRSPRRQEIFKRLDIPFTVKPADIDETTDEKDILKAVTGLAVRKLSEAVIMNRDSRYNWIFTADTLVYLKSEMLGQPESEERAYDYIKRLSGNKHSVATGIALFNRESGTKYVDSVITEVFFPHLSDDIIRWYLSTGEWKGAAGGYRIQEKGGCLVEKIVGSYSNVMGLPIRQFFCMLLSAGYPVNNIPPK